jgi:hypothetical protein
MDALTHDHSTQVRTASTINILLGIWIVISPWVYGIGSATSGMIANSIIVGGLILIFGAIRDASPHARTGFSWANIVLGAWTVISPWIYQYSGTMPRVWNSVIVGLAVIALAIWSGAATVTEHRHQQMA